MLRVVNKIGYPPVVRLRIIVEPYDFEKHHMVKSRLKAVKKLRFRVRVIALGEIRTFDRMRARLECN